MDLTFDFYFFHPCVAMGAGQPETLQMIRKFLTCGGTIVLKDPNDLLPTNPLAKPYSDFFPQVQRCAASCQSSVMLASGDSLITYAKKVIQYTKYSICLVGFPYAELRELHTFLSGIDCPEDVYANLFFTHTFPLYINLLTEENKLQVTLRKSDIGYRTLSSADQLACKHLFHGLTASTDENTPSSFIYTYTDNDTTMVMKSVRICTPDYLQRVKALIGLRVAFVIGGVKNALPQEIVYNEGAPCAVTFRYIDGVPLEKLYHDVFYEQYMEKHQLAANVLNRIYLLIQLCASVINYHSVGIYLSDIKGDNFIVDDAYNVIPIDADGFSCCEYTSSRPRCEMLPNAPKTKRMAYFQTSSNEFTSILVMVYLFLMDGNHPMPENSPFTLENISNSPHLIYDSERGRSLIWRWNQYPALLRETLSEGLLHNNPVTVENLLRVLVACYCEMMPQCPAELQNWAKDSMRLTDSQEMQWKSNPLPLLELIKPQPIQSADSSDAASSAQQEDISTTYNHYYHIKASRRRRRRNKKIAIALAFVAILVGAFLAGWFDLFGHLQGSFSQTASTAMVLTLAPEPAAPISPPEQTCKIIR